MRSFYMTGSCMRFVPATTLPRMSSNGLARHRCARARFVGWTLTFLLTGACGTGGVTSAAGPDGPAQTAYTPPAGQGPIVVGLSRHSGPGLYHGYAAQLSRLRYYSVLVHGQEIPPPGQD